MGDSGDAFVEQHVDQKIATPHVGEKAAQQDPHGSVLGRLVREGQVLDDRIAGELVGRQDEGVGLMERQ